MKNAFTLLELLAVITTACLLIAMVGLALPQMLEQAKVARVRVELRSLEAALELYAADHDRHYPPPAVSCDPGETEYVLQLPRELADEKYIPPGRHSQVSSLMEDPFNPRHTYRYVAPERYWQNGELQDRVYFVWVPHNFPDCQSTSGSLTTNNRSKFAWGVWSIGPRASITKGLNNRAPTAAATWYQKTGDHGVIGLIREREGKSFFTL